MQSPALPHGVVPSLPTLFAPDGGVDPAALRAVARFAADAGAAGVVCFGLAGEVSRLGVDERKRLLRALCAEVGGRIPIIPGVTAESLVQSLDLVEDATRQGAAAVVIPPPTAYALDEESLVDFFVAVARATPLPVIVQDAPEYLGVSVRPEAVVAAARDAPNIRAVKVETGPEGIERWRARLGPGFDVYGGNGGLFLLDSLEAGATGVMPGADTVDLQVAIADALSSGRRDDAAETFRRLLPMLVFEMQSIDHYNACAKHVLRRRGLPCETELRLPGPQRLGASSIRRLEAYVESLGLTPIAATVS